MCNLQRKIGNKPLLHITAAKASKYGKHLDHTVEMIFKPMGTTGHSYLRVGRNIYDFAYMARANSFQAPTGNAYGFVMATTPAKIQKLQQGFNQLMARDPDLAVRQVNSRTEASSSSCYSHGLICASPAPSSARVSCQR